MHAMNKTSPEILPMVGTPEIISAKFELMLSIEHSVALVKLSSIQASTFPLVYLKSQMFANVFCLLSLSVLFSVAVTLVRRRTHA